MCKDNKMGCHKMLKSWGLLALRIALAIIFIYQGYNKLGPNHDMTSGMMAGLFGGGGSELAYLVGFLEFVGGFMLLLGVYAPVAAMWLSVIMIVAILTVHRGGPIPGYFLPLSALGGLLALMGTGAGKYRLLKMQCCCKKCKAGCMMCGTGSCGDGGGCSCGGGACTPGDMGMKAGAMCGCKGCCGGNCGCGMPGGNCGCCKK